jgi:CheY-like chemotaxis protein
MENSMAHALVIDDNETGISVIGALLVAQNVSYTGINDPTKIRAVLEEISDFDVIFLDLEMPEINGYEMLDILKNKIGVSAPVIAYSVYTAEISTTRKQGFDGYLSKPLRRENFPDQLKRILAGQEVWVVD